MIRVVVADDQALVRGGFRVLVDSAPDLEVVGEASDGAEAVELARAQRPGVVLMESAGRGVVAVMPWAMPMTTFAPWAANTCDGDMIFSGSVK